ncbi:Gfo/Idh/MocA family oxidoreductase [Aliiglaciecola sp. 3_MG-2023]|uniref:Gfo/Idh/MocA family protein n=1 Tax=Aliiglaciecola sp. 3_MG-2023 TaxID=3062644 RepID=UPI0026E18B4C|nr:Gfo/Idh/MocA family oxidoreductase [Aliiglaciecola sp. 3_MG-2023]MDO6693971.1 Gfo/Idh/MocA family oxidoreductase [Aliiglaciecola sp. 3_MG-2023]
MLNWGVIGPGGIANQFATALASSVQGKLYGVASRNLARAEAFAQQYRATVAYGDYESLIADPNIDVIYIATPHSHHFPIARACLQAGKHLLMEKPLTVNAQQTEVLVSLSAQHKCVFQEAMWSRFMPCFEQLKEWIEQQEIGELEYINSQIGFAFSHLKNHRLTDPALAGGALLDLGVYSVSLSQYLLAEYPTRVQAVAKLSADGVDQNTMVNLTYPSGVISQFTCTMAAECSNIMSIHGKEGYICVPAYFWNGRQAQLYQNEKLIRTVDFPHPVNGFEYQIESTMESILLGRRCDPRMNHADSINVMQTLDVIRQQITLNYPECIESLD